MSPAQQSLMAAEKVADMVPADGMSLFERLARDPGASVEKIERLMALWERQELRKAEAAFNRAMAKAQKAMRPVLTDSENSQTNSRYPSYEALDNAIRPIYTRHGFGLSFDSGKSDLPECVLVLCYVSHDAGFTRTYKIDMPADGKGAKGGAVMTRTHATGSAMTYGQRYLLKLIFNVAVSIDDDGNRAGKTQPANRAELHKPDEFDAWWDFLQDQAENGIAAVTAAFNKAEEPFRKYLLKTNKEGWDRLKESAGGR